MHLGHLHMTSITSASAICKWHQSRLPRYLLFGSPSFVSVIGSWHLPHIRLDHQHLAPSSCASEISSRLITAMSRKCLLRAVYPVSEAGPVHQHHQTQLVCLSKAHCAHNFQGIYDSFFNHPRQENDRKREVEYFSTLYNFHIIPYICKFQPQSSE